MTKERKIAIIAENICRHYGITQEEMVLKRSNDGKKCGNKYGNNMQLARAMFVILAFDLGVDDVAISPVIGYTIRSVSTLQWRTRAQLKARAELVEEYERVMQRVRNQINQEEIGGGYIAVLRNLLKELHYSNEDIILITSRYEEAICGYVD